MEGDVQNRKVEQQRTRRLSRRPCGNPGCEEKAVTMLDWGGRQIAIGQRCLDLLRPFQTISSACGNPGCGENADDTVDWDGRQITICKACKDRLSPSPRIDRSCVLEEIRHYWSVRGREAQRKPGLIESVRDWLGL